MTEDATGLYTGFISNDPQKFRPTHYAICPVCHGRVMFNPEELAQSLSKSIYCAGLPRTTGGSDPRNHWHPSDGGAEPRFEIPWAQPEPTTSSPPAPQT